MATPEGVVRDSPNVDGGGGNGENGDGGGGGGGNGDDQDAAERARQLATRHCGWVPSTSNGVEVRCFLSRDVVVQYTVYRLSVATSIRHASGVLL